MMNPDPDHPFHSCD